jgi:hypothetical protein
VGQQDKTKQPSQVHAHVCVFMCVYAHAHALVRCCVYEVCDEIFKKANNNWGKVRNMAMPTNESYTPKE